MYKKKLKFVILLVLFFSFSICIIFNVYGVFILPSVGKTPIDARSHGNKSYGYKSIEIKIMQYFSKLQPVYKNNNPEFLPVLFDIRDGLKFDSESNGLYNYHGLWENHRQWPNKDSLFPEAGHHLSLALEALKLAKITGADNAKKGTQLKLLLTLEGNQTVIFKPRWYDKGVVIPGRVYEGHDRHNSEVLGFLLALLMNIRLSPVSVIRSINLKNDVWANATPGLKKTITFRGQNKQVCVYGECLYCGPKYSVCANEINGQLEGATILVVPRTFKSLPSPWRRTYKKEPALWENDPNYCRKVGQALPLDRILNLVDVAIFDFLLQNGDRHHYEVYEGRVLFMDNGKGLGNPHQDHIDILAPLYHCCVLRNSTWDRLLLLSGQMLSYSVQTLERFVIPADSSGLTTSLHLKALDRRMLKVFAAIHFCFDSKGAHRVFKS